MGRLENKFFFSKKKEMVLEIVEQLRAKNQILSNRERKTFKK